MLANSTNYGSLILAFLSSYWWAIVIIFLLIAILVTLCRVGIVLCDILEKLNSKTDNDSTDSKKS